MKLRQTSAASSNDNSLVSNRIFNITSVVVEDKKRSLMGRPLQGRLGYVLWTSQRSQCTVLCRRLGSRSGHSSDVPSPCNDVMFWNDRSSSARTGVRVMDEWFLWTEFCLRVFFFLFFDGLILLSMDHGRSKVCTLCVI